MIKLYSIILSLFLLLTVPNDVYAGHIAGYDLSLINIKDQNGVPTDQYKFRLKYYRDNASAMAPPSFSCIIRENNTHVEVRSVDLSKVNPYTLISSNPGSCSPVDMMILEYRLYESSPIDLSGLNHADGYYIHRSSFSRIEGLKNVEGNSGEEGVMITMDFPPLNSTSAYRYNSSPEFPVFTPDFYCVNKLYTKQISCTDPNNDSLVYSLVQPFAGGDNQDTKPFQTLPYASGYSVTNIINGAPDLSIDSKTGILSFKPTLAGMYLVAIKVDEYRNGIKIGEVRKEFEFEIFDCEPETKPAVRFGSVNDRNISATVHVGQTLDMEFHAADSPDEEFQLVIIPVVVENDKTGNIFDLRNGALWGVHTDSLNSSPKVIKGTGAISGYLRWTPECFPAREEPYMFMVVASDYTCPSGLADTLHVSIVVTGDMTHPKPAVSVIRATLLSVPDIYDSYQWYLNDEKIEGATGPTYLTEESAGYYVEVVDSGLCPVYSNTVFTFIITYDDNDFRNEVIRVYPNPTANNINISSDRNIKSVLITNLMGKVLYKEEKDKIETVSFENLDSGIYILTITDENGGFFNKKILKQ